MKAFDLHRMALDKVPLDFLWEVALRSLYTFVLVFLFLKITGRRGVRQMSLFEVLIILTLGSAAGDVAFYDDVPMLPVLVVFITLGMLYRLVMWLMSHSEKLEDLLEGKPVVIVKDGELAWEKLHEENLTEFEFFMELRTNGVDQLGQVRLAIMETNGQLSVYYFTDEEVKPGLCILPEGCSERFKRPLKRETMFACAAAKLSRFGWVKRKSARAVQIRNGRRPVGQFASHNRVFIGSQ